MDGTGPATCLTCNSGFVLLDTGGCTGSAPGCPAGQYVSRHATATSVVACTNCAPHCPSTPHPSVAGTDTHCAACSGSAANACLACTSGYLQAGTCSFNSVLPECTHRADVRTDCDARSLDSIGCTVTGTTVDCSGQSLALAPCNVPLDTTSLFGLGACKLVSLRQPLGQQRHHQHPDRYLRLADRHFGHVRPRNDPAYLTSCSDLSANALTTIQAELFAGLATLTALLAACCTCLPWSHMQ